MVDRNASYHDLWLPYVHDNSLLSYVSTCPTVPYSFIILTRCAYQLLTYTRAAQAHDVGAFQTSPASATSCSSPHLCAQRVVGGPGGASCNGRLHACVCLPHQIGPQGYRCSVRDKTLPLYTCGSPQSAKASGIIDNGDNTRGQADTPKQAHNLQAIRDVLLGLQATQVIGLLDCTVLQVHDQRQGLPKPPPGLASSTFTRFNWYNALRQTGTCLAWKMIQQGQGFRQHIAATIYLPRNVQGPSL